MSITRLANDKGSTNPALLTAAFGEVHALRIVLADRSISLPIASLERWERKVNRDREELAIAIGRQMVVVRGQGLEILHDALDGGTARRIQPGTGSKGAEGAIRITEIKLTNEPQGGPPS